MTKPYRILVTGSRDWSDGLLVRKSLAEAAASHPGPVIVVHGACPTGADMHAAYWVVDVGRGCGASEEPHPANWQLEGKRAGFIRNARMVNLGADICLAFIKDGSRGASHTARLAEEAGIPVRRWTA